MRDVLFEKSPLGCVRLLEACDIGKLRIPVHALPCAGALLRLATDKIVLPQEALDHRDTDLDAMIGGEVVGNLPVRQVGSFDRRIHGRASRVPFQHLEKGRVQPWDHLMAGLTTAAFSTDARLLQGLGLPEFLHALGNGMPVTAEDAHNITEAAASELAGFDGGIPAPVFF